MWKSSNILTRFRILRQTGAALLCSVAYTAVTLPDGGGIWFGAMEAVLASVAGLTAWNGAAAAVKFRPSSLLPGAGYYAALVLFCTALALVPAMAVSAATDFFSAFAAAVPVKLFCLVSVLSAATLGSILYVRSNIETEEAEAGFDPAPTAVVHPIETLTSVSVKNGSDISIFDVNDIIYLKAEGDYVNIVTIKGKYLKEQTMKYFAEALPQDRFIRIHRSHIINSRCLQNIERYGDYQMVVMSDGTRIRISATGYRLLKEKLGL